jgi:hypothetical protein
MARPGLPPSIPAKEAPVADRLFVGDEVTVLPPYDTLPYILRFQRYARVAAGIDQPVVTVELTDTYPPGQRFEVPKAQLVRGWRDNTGRWRMP